MAFCHPAALPVYDLDEEIDFENLIFNINDAIFFSEHSSVG
jgi:hypothetical protein